MERSPKKESQPASPSFLYLPACGTLVGPVSGESGREQSHPVQDQVEVALGSVGHNRNHSLQPRRNGELVPVQAFSRGQRQWPGRTLQQAGNSSNGEKQGGLELGQQQPSLSPRKIQGMLRTGASPHLGLRQLHRVCLPEELQHLPLDVSEVLTSCQHCPKSLVQEKLKEKEPSPRCSHGLTRQERAGPRWTPPPPGAGRASHDARLWPAAGAAQGKRLLGTRERKAVKSGCVGRAPAPAPAPVPGRTHTFSQEPAAELPSRWLSSWLRPMVQALSSTGSSDARRNWCERERKRVFP